MNEKIRIGELAQRAGVTPRTIRCYESLGLLEPSKREGTGFRYYTEAKLAKLRKIDALKALGLTLEEISSIVDVIDLYYRHRVDPRVPVEETIGAMAELYSKVKFATSVFLRQLRQPFGLSMPFIRLLHCKQSNPSEAATQKMRFYQQSGSWELGLFPTVFRTLASVRTNYQQMNLTGLTRWHPKCDDGRSLPRNANEQCQSVEY